MRTTTDLAGLYDSIYENFYAEKEKIAKYTPFITAGVGALGGGVAGGLTTNSRMEGEGRGAHKSRKLKNMLLGAGLGAGAGFGGYKGYKYLYPGAGKAGKEVVEEAAGAAAPKASKELDVEKAIKEDPNVLQFPTQEKKVAVGKSVEELGGKPGDKVGDLEASARSKRRAQKTDTSKAEEKFFGEPLTPRITDKIDAAMKARGIMGDNAFQRIRYAREHAKGFGGRVSKNTMNAYTPELQAAEHAKILAELKEVDPLLRLAKNKEAEKAAIIKAYRNAMFPDAMVDAIKTARARRRMMQKVAFRPGVGYGANAISNPAIGSGLGGAPARPGKLAGGMGSGIKSPAKIKAIKPAISSKIGMGSRGMGSSAISPSKGVTKTARAMRRLRR